MLVQTNIPEKFAKVEADMPLRVDYYLGDDEEASNWIEEHTDQGENMIVENFNIEDNLIKFKHCPYLIPVSICIYLDGEFEDLLNAVKDANIETNHEQGWKSK